MRLIDTTIKEQTNQIYDMSDVIQNNPNIVPDMPIDEYHACDGLSSTGVSLILDCPARYNYKYNVERHTLTPQELLIENKKYAKGRMVHTLVLEPEKFDSQYYVMQEECDLRTKDGKAAWAIAADSAGDREMVRLSDIKDVIKMSDAIKSMPIFQYLENGNIEHSIFWNDGIYNTALRARPDVYTDELIVDLKTTSSIVKFEHSIRSFGYYRQAAMQVDGLYKATGRHRAFGFLVVEDKAPYLTKLISLRPDYLEIGRQQYLHAADLYSECKATGIWNGYGDSFTEIETPKYLISEEYYVN